jgi:hypothetical protein
VDDNIIYTPDQLNTFFATPKTVSPSNTKFDSALDSTTEKFSTTHQIRSNAILTYYRTSPMSLTPTVLMLSSDPSSWKLSKTMPVVKTLKTNNPGRLSDYSSIIILPALSKAMEIIMRDQINSTSIGLWIKPQHNQNPPKNNE